jgi:hypothetical protein
VKAREAEALIMLPRNDNIMHQMKSKTSDGRTAVLGQTEDSTVPSATRKGASVFARTSSKVAPGINSRSVNPPA